MPAIARDGDATIMDLSIALPSTVTATTVKAYADGKAIVRIGDALATHQHYIGSHWYPWIGAVMTEGSNVDFVEGIGVCRVGDHANCGCKISAGSSDAFSE